MDLNLIRVCIPVDGRYRKIPTLKNRLYHVKPVFVIMGVVVI